MSSTSSRLLLDENAALAHGGVIFTRVVFIRAEF